MRRVVVLVGMVVLVSGVGSGLTDYAVPLERSVDDSDTEELQVDGSYDIDFSDRLLTMELSFRVNLTEQEFSRTDIDDFMVTMMAPGSDPVASMDVGDVTVHQGERAYVPWKTMEGETAVTELDYMLFQVNHTPRDQDGDTLDERQVSGRVATPRVLVEPALESLESNVSSAMRGGSIYVHGEVDDIGVMNMSWNRSDAVSTMSLDDNTFGAWMDVPTDLATGMHDLPLTVTTGRGEIFTRTIRLDVENRPPAVSLDHPRSMPTGSAYQLSVDATDDTGVAAVDVTFQGDPVDPDDGMYEYVLPTTDLGPGGYEFTVTVTDENGASVTETGDAVLTADDVAGGNGGGTRDTGDGGEDGEYSENTSTLISIVNSVRGLFESLLFG